MKKSILVFFIQFLIFFQSSFCQILSGIEMGPTQAVGQNLGAIGAIFPVDDKIVLCNGFQGSNAIYRTDDINIANPSWTRVLGDDNALDGAVVNFARNPNSTNEIIALKNTSEGKRIYFSDNFGLSWTMTSGINLSNGIKNFIYRNDSKGQMEYESRDLYKIIYSKQLFRSLPGSPANRPLLVTYNNEHLYITKIAAGFDYKLNAWDDRGTLGQDKILQVEEERASNGWFWIRTPQRIYCINIFEKTVSGVNGLDINSYLTLPGGIDLDLSSLQSRNPTLSINAISSVNFDIDNANRLYVFYTVTTQFGAGRTIIEEVITTKTATNVTATISRVFHNTNTPAPTPSAANVPVPYAKWGLFKINPANSNFMYYEDGSNSFDFRTMIEFNLTNSTNRPITTGNHVDVRCLVIDQPTSSSPNNATCRMLIGNDGGISFSSDIASTNAMNRNGSGLNIDRFWRVGISKNYKGQVIGGAQDGNTFVYNFNNENIYLDRWMDGFKPIFNSDLRNFSNINRKDPSYYFNENKTVDHLNPALLIIQNTTGNDKLSPMSYLLRTRQSSSDPSKIISSSSDFTSFIFIDANITNTSGSVLSPINHDGLPGGQPSSPKIVINNVSGFTPTTFDFRQYHTGKIAGIVESKVDLNRSYFVRSGILWWDVSNSTLALVGGVYQLNINNSTPSSSTVFNLTDGLFETSTLGSNTNQMTPLTDGSTIACIAVGKPTISPVGTEVIFVGMKSSGNVVNSKVYGRHIGATSNGSWINYSINLPNEVQVSSLLFNNIDDVLFAGTNKGLYYIDLTLPSSSYVWTRVASIPQIEITDLEIQECEGVLYASSFGGGMFRVELPSSYGSTASINSLNLIPTLIECHGGKGKIVSELQTTPNICNNNASYSWSYMPLSSGAITPLPFNTGTIEEIVAGIYSVTVTLKNGVTATASYTLNEPTPLEAILTVKDISCFGLQDGTINASGFGGTQPYRLTLYNSGGNLVGNPHQPILNYANLNADIYSLQLRDANKCYKPYTGIIISEPDQLMYSASINHVKCYGTNMGSIIGFTSGGSSQPSGYTYELTGSYFNGMQMLSQSNSSGNFNNLFAGTYSIKTTDSRGCTVTNSNLIITQPSLLVYSPTVTSVLCYGNATGEITGVATGGVFPYFYKLTEFDASGNPINTSTNSNGLFIGLKAGSYNVLVTDGNGCTVDKNINITQPPQLVYNPNITSVLCYNNSTGSIIGTISGGTPSFGYVSILTGTDYSGNSVVQSNNTGVFTGLKAGTYSIETKDFNQCKLVHNNLIISQPTPIVYNPTVTSVLCNGNNTGSIIGNVSGGITPYTSVILTGNDYLNRSVNKSFSTVDNGFIGLYAGSYQVKIIDGNSCEKIFNVVITQPNPITIDLELIDFCHFTTNGKIKAISTGGTGLLEARINNNPYFLMTPFAGKYEHLFSSLSAGMHVIDVREVNNPSCLVSKTINVVTTPLIVSAAFVTNANGAIVTVNASGGTPINPCTCINGYTYSMDNSGNFQESNNFQVCPGVHTFQAKDAYGCIKSTLPITISSGAIQTELISTLAAHPHNPFPAGNLAGVGSPFPIWEQRFIDQKLIIDMNYTFSYVQFNMAPGASIEISSGVTVNFDHCKFTNGLCGNNLWEGIIAKDGAAFQIQESIIRRAQYGIKMSGAITTSIINNRFESNFVGIYIQDVNSQVPGARNSINLTQFFGNKFEEMAVSSVAGWDVQMNDYPSYPGQVNDPILPSVTDYDCSFDPVFPGGNCGHRRSFAGMVICDAVLTIGDPVQSIGIENEFVNTMNGIISIRSSLDIYNTLFLVGNTTGHPVWNRSNCAYINYKPFPNANPGNNNAIYATNENDDPTVIGKTLRYFGQGANPANSVPAINSYQKGIKVEYGMNLKVVDTRFNNPAIAISATNCKGRKIIVENNFIGTSRLLSIPIDQCYNVPYESEYLGVLLADNRTANDNVLFHSISNNELELSSTSGIRIQEPVNVINQFPKLNIFKNSLKLTYNIIPFTNDPAYGITLSGIGGYLNPFSNSYNTIVSENTVRTNMYSNEAFLFENSYTLDINRNIAEGVIPALMPPTMPNPYQFVVNQIGFSFKSSNQYFAPSISNISCNSATGMTIGFRVEGNCSPSDFNSNRIGEPQPKNMNDVGLFFTDNADMGPQWDKGNMWENTGLFTVLSYAPFAYTNTFKVPGIPPGGSQNPNDISYHAPAIYSTTPMNSGWFDFRGAQMTPYCLGTPIEPGDLKKGNESIEIRKDTKKVNNFELVLIPNPTSDFIYFNVDENLITLDMSSITIKSLDGKIISGIQAERENTKVKLNVKSLASAVYTLSVKDEKTQKTYIKLFVKE